MSSSADFVPTSPHVPADLPVDAEAIAERFKLTPEEGERVLHLALVELDRATQSAWRRVPVPTWEDWIIRVCGAIYAAKKRPTAGASQGTSADQAQPRPAQPRDYTAVIRQELANYVAWGIG